MLDLQNSLTKPSPTLPSPSTPQGLYSTVVVHNGIAYVSGQLPRLNNELQFTGKVGDTIDVETAQKAARLCAQQCLSVLADAVGGIENIGQLLKVTGFIASAQGFIQQPQVMDAASAVFREVLGSRRNHARSSIGVSELPRGAPVEIEIVAAITSK